jgi:hypothetical protein
MKTPGDSPSVVEPLEGRRLFSATAVAEVPPRLPPLPQNVFVDYALGDHHVIALRDDGEVWSAGSTPFGTLGHGTWALDGGSGQLGKRPFAALELARNPKGSVDTVPGSDGEGGGGGDPAVTFNAGWPCKRVSFGGH